MATIDELLAKLSNNQNYSSAYTDQINNTLNSINNYGNYSSKYADQIADTTDQIANYGDYNSKYGDSINSLVDKLTNNYNDFSYDYTTDPLYQQYSEQYTRNGKRAMQDTLGQVSARTGGLASTYAGSAAQQSYNQYMQELADKIPELEERAYNRWNDSYTRDNSTLSTLSNLDSTDYSRWADTRSNLYNLLSMYNTQDDTDYSRWSDTRSNLYNLLSAYQNQDSNALSQWQAQNSADYNLLSALQNEADRQAAAYSSSSGGGTGTAKAVAADETPSYTYTDIAGSLEQMIDQGGSYSDAYAMIVNAYDADYINKSQKEQLQSRLSQFKSDSNGNIVQNNAKATDWRTYMKTWQ